MPYMYKLLIQTGADVTYTPDPDPPTVAPAPLPVVQEVMGTHAGRLAKNGENVHLTVLPASEPGEPPVVVLRFE